MFVNLIKHCIILCIREKTQIWGQVRNERNCFDFCVCLCDSQHYFIMRICCTKLKIRMYCTELKIGTWKKIVYRRKSESQADPNKQIKSVIVFLHMQCVRSKGWGKAQNVIGWNWPAGLTSVAPLKKSEMGGQGICFLEDIQKTGHCQTLWSSKTCSRTFKISLPTLILTEQDRPVG